MEKNGLLYHRFQNGKLFEDHIDQLVVPEVLRNDIADYLQSPDGALRGLCQTSLSYCALRTNQSFICITY